jgi:hypothetical protein
MGPLSAVAIAVWLFIVGLVWVATITASLHFFLGVLAIIVAIVVLLDAFWIGSGARWATYRDRRGRPVA